MLNIPVTIIIGLLAVLLGAWLQRRQWYRNTREEIRVRETDEANKLISDIARIVDKRLAVQRAFINHSASEDRDDFLRNYRGVILDYATEYNSLRSRLMFYFGWHDVLEFEKEINDKIVFNGMEAEALYKGQKDREVVSRLQHSIDLISRSTYKLCAGLASKVAKEEFGSMRKINRWQDADNAYVSVGSLAKRFLNI